MPRETNKVILARLEEWKKQDAPLPQYLTVYAQLLQREVEMESSLLPVDPPLTSEQAEQRLRQGQSLLDFDAIAFDWKVVHEHYRAIVDVIDSNLANEDDESHRMTQIADNFELFRQIIEDWYKNIPLSSIAIEACVPEQLLNATLQAVMKPFLTVHAEAMAGLVKQELWRRRYCPVCHGKADFAYLDKARSSRWLVCSRCDTEWLYQRLECPHCGTQEQTHLSYLTDETETYRLYVCKNCHKYIKAIDLAKTNEVILMPLERIMTLDLDRQANEAGYQPG